MVPLNSKASWEEIKAFIKRMHAECLHEIAACTVPFYAEQGGAAVQCGSGVLLEVAHRQFVLTAAHVSDIQIVHHLPFFVSNTAAGESLIPFEKVILRTSQMPASGCRKDDPFDICVGELPQAIVTQLRVGKRFCHLRDIDPVDTQVNGSWYFVLGFPTAANPSDINARRVSTNVFAYGSIKYDGERGDLQRYDPHLEFALDFSLLRNTDDDGNPVTPPPPGGMSGCGIWRLASGGSSIPLWTPEDKRLVAIQHTWNKEVEALRATRIEYALQIIYEKYPDLRAAMRLNHEKMPLKW
jgi:hypothetical protein